MRSITDRFVVLLGLLLITAEPVPAADDLSVLTASPQGVMPSEWLADDFRRQAFELLEQRRTRLNDVRSRAACLAWQEERRAFFLQQIGGLPERTPLNARVAGELQGDGYRVEKVLFESRPRHHVSANLYLPVTPGPFPAVLVPCGHSHNGKASGQYQRVCMLLARNGMAALCYDPIGQGERYQMLNFENDQEHFASTPGGLKVPHPRVQYLCTIEHTAMGLGSILLGSNTAQFSIWDGMRAIDYLQSRDDIIADKIGCTGNSGGGTLTAYLMALDERIVAAAPACYLTTFERLLQTKGPQDAEQNIFDQIRFGMDEPDYVMLRAPRPTLICAARRDATFDIEGAWDLYRQSKVFYATLGYPERVDISDADQPHGFHLPQREAAARWMHRWLLGTDKVIHEVDPATLPDPPTDAQLYELHAADWTQEQLYCSPEGQVLLMDDERSVFDINAAAEQQVRQKRATAWNSKSDSERRQQVRELIGSQGSATASGHASDSVRSEWKSIGTVQRDGYKIHKLILTSGSSISLPALAFVPDQPVRERCLYLHGDSMQADADVGGSIEARVRQGQLVLSAELRGIGETGPQPGNRSWGRGHFGGDIQEFFLAYLIGQSYVGLRADDVLAWSDVAMRFPADDEATAALHLMAQGEAAIPALHAAALAPRRFSTVTLKNMIQSWSEIVAQPRGRNLAVNVVHGALLHYDLPDLIASCGPDIVQVEDRVDVVGELVEWSEP